MFCLEVVFLFCASVLSVVKRLCFANLSKQLNVGRKPAYWEEVRVEWFTHPARHCRLLQRALPANGAVNLQSVAALVYSVCVYVIDGGLLIRILDLF